MFTKVDFFSLMAASLLFVGYSAYDRNVKSSAPATEFFEVKNINIPDFTQGTDPVMAYDRTIKKNFIGTFIVEIHKAEKDVHNAVCSNSATRTYKANEQPPDIVTLDWFVDRKCGLPPGQYVVETTWKIEAEGYPAKEYSALSNVFRVLPEGAQAYVTPEQVMQLEVAKELLENPLPLIGGDTSQ